MTINEAKMKLEQGQQSDDDDYIPLEFADWREIPLLTFFEEMPPYEDVRKPIGALGSQLAASLTRSGRLRNYAATGNSCYSNEILWTP